MTGQPRTSSIETVGLPHSSSSGGWAERIGVPAQAATGWVKTARNLLVRRNVVRLRPGEVYALCHLLGLTKPTFVPTANLRQALRTGVWNNLINFIDFSGRVYPLDSHSTYPFIQDVVGGGLPYQRTALYREVMAGREREKLRSEAAFQSYYEKCMTLAASVRTHGVLDIARKNRHEETNICVAISDTGELLHYKKGHHRLAIAHALGVERIPVNVSFISGEYLLRYTGGGRHPWKLRRAVQAAVADAFCMHSAYGGPPEPAVLETS